MIIYPCKNNTPFYIIIKLFLYLFLLSFFIILLHNSTLRNKYKETERNGEMYNIIDNIDDNRIIYGSSNQIKPNVKAHYGGLIKDHDFKNYEQEERDIDKMLKEIGV